MMSTRGSPWAVLAGHLVLCVAVLGCSERPSTALIGLAGVPSQHDAIAVAREALDLMSERGGPAIEFHANRSTGTSALARTVGAVFDLVSTPGVVAAMGPLGSRDAVLSVPLLREAGIPHVVPTVTSTAVTNVGPWTFALAPSDSAEGEFIGGYVATTLGARAATIFYQPDEYGRGLLEATTSALVDRGVAVIGQVPVPQLACRSEDWSVIESAVVASLRRGHPDAVILVTPDPETACIARLVHERVPEARFIAADATVLTAGVAAAGDALDALYAVWFWHPALEDPRSRDFVERFRAIHGREPGHSDALEYDAILLLAQAIQDVGADREAIARYLRELGGKRPLYWGVTGPIRFGPDGRADRARFVLVRARDRAPEIVEVM